MGWVILILLVLFVINCGWKLRNFMVEVLLVIIVFVVNVLDNVFFNFWVGKNCGVNVCYKVEWFLVCEIVLVFWVCFIVLIVGVVRMLFCLFLICKSLFKLDCFK